jgi:beta-lactamase regulating signal transducer with metallopeptidase domain
LTAPASPWYGIDTGQGGALPSKTIWNYLAIFPLHKIFGATQIVESLLSISIHAAVITACILLFRTASKKHISPRLQYALWFLVVLRLLFPFVLESDIHFRFEPQPIRNTASSSGQSDATVSAEPEVTDGIRSPPYTSSALPTISPFGATYDWYAVAFFVWITGAACSAAWLTFVKLRYVHLLRRCSSTAPEQVNAAYRACCESLCMKPIPLWVVNQTVSPGILFFGGPILILPTSLTRSKEPLHFALLHELMHKKRGDHLMTELLNLLRVVYWFNPVMHFTFAELRADMETACDADVLGKIGADEKRGYFTTILNLFSYETAPRSA